MPRPARSRIRVDLVALFIVAVVVVSLVVLLVVRDQATRRSAALTSYPLITQTAQPQAVPSVAFIGDSYSAGTGSSGYDSRFTTLIAAYEGWSSQSFAYGGTGYLREATENSRTGCGADSCPSYTQVLERVVQADPSIVFVSGGRNDVGLPQASVARAVDDFYDSLRKQLPRARVIATSPVWAYSRPPDQLAQIQAAVRSAASRIGATYLDLGEPLVEDRDLVSDDKVHPNNAGHAKLAQTAEVALSEAPEASSSPSPTPTD